MKTLVPYIFQSECVEKCSKHHLDSLFVLNLFQNRLFYSMNFTRVSMVSHIWVEFFFQKLALKKRAKILPVSTLIVIFLFKSSVFLNLIYLESFRMRESREQMSHDFIKLESDSTKEIIWMTFQKFNIDVVCRVFFLVTHWFSSSLL